MNSKLYLNSIIVIAVVIALVAVFGASNHFMGYYDPKGTIAKSNSNKKDPDPTPTPNPDPNPQPQPGQTDRELYGYKCNYENCSLLAGTNVINNKYVFIVDGTENIVLFDTEKKEIYDTYTSVSKSGTNFIVKNKDAKYGVIYITSEVTTVIPFEYTFVEYISNKNNYILTKNSSSFVSNSKGEAITLTYNAQIIDYNDLYIITKTTNGDYHIFNFNNRTELTEYVNSKRILIELVSNYVGVVTEDYMYRLYDFQNGNKVLLEEQLEKSSTNIYAKINGANKLEIYANNALVKTVDLP